MALELYTEGGFNAILHLLYSYLQMKSKTKIHLISGIVIVNLLTLAWPLSPLIAQTNPARTQAVFNNPSTDYVTGEVLVRFKKTRVDLSQNSGRDKAHGFADSKKLHLKKQLNKTNTILVTSKEGQTVAELIAKLSNDPSIESVQPNYRYRPAAINTNDTHRANLWGLENTGQSISDSTGTADADIDLAGSDATVWSQSTGEGIIVAVIDTGVHFNHPDLSANMWNGANCVNPDGNNLGGCLHGFDFEFNDLDPTPTSNLHGTHVAGTIAATGNNNIGIVGVAPSAKIMALKTSLLTSEIVDAISFADQNGATIINASWGGRYNDPVLRAAIESYSGVFVAAAGNDSVNHITNNFYPCDYTLVQIICVTATDFNDQLASFSDYGSASVHVAAPGKNIYSTSITFNSADTVSLSETFESLTPPAVPASWTTTGTWGTKSVGNPHGVVLAGDAQNIPYAPNANQTITLPNLDMNGSSAASISYFTSCDTEYTTTAWKDYLQLEFSADNGASYYAMKRIDEAYLDEFTGDSSATGAATHQFTESIPSFFLTGNFRIRWRWFTDAINSPAENYQGCFFNNLTVTNTVSSVNASNYIYLSGTSMAVPHVTGLAALLQAADISLTVAQVKEIILNTGDNLPTLNGKIVSGKRINATNALAALSAESAEDIEPPVITQPNDVVLEATSANGALALFTLPSVSDADTTVVVVCSVAPGIDTVPLGNTVVTCNATDSSGNVAVPVEFTITTSDTTPPAITLNGSTNITITAGGKYAEVGATALDLVDGAVTPTVGGQTVLTSTVGTYVVTYTAIDIAGNSSSTNRTVVIRAASSGGGGGGGSSGGGSTVTLQSPVTPTPSTLPSSSLPTNTEAHSNGTLILDGQTVYLIKDGQRYGFRNEEEYKSHGYNFSQVVPANAADLALPMSTGVVKALEGTLVLDVVDGRTVYMIGSNGTKRGFSSAAIFIALGYKFENLPAINLGDYPSGSPITSSSAPHPDGALVFEGQTVWWIKGSQRQGFESAAVFNTYGFSFNKIVPANSNDLALSVGSLVKFRDGTLVNDGENYYLISDGRKQLFVSTTTLLSQGYHLHNVIQANLSSYTLSSKID